MSDLLTTPHHQQSPRRRTSSSTSDDEADTQPKHIRAHDDTAKLKGKATIVSATLLQLYQLSPTNLLLPVPTVTSWLDPIRRFLGWPTAQTRKKQEWEIRAALIQKAANELCLLKMLTRYLLCGSDDLHQRAID